MDSHQTFFPLPFFFHSRFLFSLSCLINFLRQNLIFFLDERDAWKIPPCISNWKNPKGYIISLDKRLATDGRDLQENTISDSFAYFSDGTFLSFFFSQPFSFVSIYLFALTLTVAHFLIHFLIHSPLFFSYCTYSF